MMKDRRSRAVVLLLPLIQMTVFPFAATYDITDVKTAFLVEAAGGRADDLVARFTGSPTFERVATLTQTAQITPLIDSRAAALVHAQQALARMAARDPELAQLGLELQAVAALDLDGGHAAGPHGRQALGSRLDQVLLARGPGGPDRGQDPPALGEQIGAGGMGTVYAAEHTRLPQKLAIKVISGHLDDDSVARFRREAEIASGLGHANIVRVMDFNTLPDGAPYMVMEYLERNGDALTEASRGEIGIEHWFRRLLKRRHGGPDRLVDTDSLQAAFSEVAPRACGRCRTLWNSHIDEEAPLDLDAVADATREAYDCGAQLAVEPGRYVVADAALLLARVVTAKPTPETTVVGLDAGMTDLLRPAMYDAYHHVWSLAPDAGSRAEVDCLVAGPICETSDVLGRDRPLPDPERGDLLAVGNAGAYGYEMASNYNSRPRPAVVTTDGAVVARRETLADVTRLERENA